MNAYAYSNFRAGDQGEWLLVHYPVIPSYSRQNAHTLKHTHTPHIHIYIQTPYNIYAHVKKYVRTPKHPHTYRSPGRGLVGGVLLLGGWGIVIDVIVVTHRRTGALQSTCAI